MTNTSFYLYENFFKTLSNKTRFNIIMFLINGPKSVGKIAKELKFEQSRISHNLKKLECYGFVICASKGKNRIYSIDKKYIFPIIANINRFMIKYKKRLDECNKLVKGGN